MSETGIKFDRMALYHIGHMAIALGRLTKERLGVLMIVWANCDEVESWRGQVLGQGTAVESTFAEACSIFVTVLQDLENKGRDAGLFKPGEWPFISSNDDFVYRVRLEILAKLGVDIRPSIHDEE